MFIDFKERGRGGVRERERQRETERNQWRNFNQLPSLCNQTKDPFGVWDNIPTN